MENYTDNQENGEKRPVRRPVAKRSIDFDKKPQDGETEIKTVKAVNTDYTESGDKDREVRFSSKKKNVKGGGKRIGTIIAIALVSLALVVGLVVLIMYLSGFRYVNNSFRYSDSETEYSITYFGKIDGKDNPCDGKLSYSDGSSAVVSVNTDGAYKLEYSNGSVYTGEIENMHRNGNGTLTLKNGDKYTGAFSYDLFNGYGTYEYSSGDRYEGYFASGKKSGSGVYTWANGDSYTGSFADNLRSGEGKYVYSDGTVYEGKFVEDKKQDDNGKLTIAYEDGTSDVYVGSFVADVREGIGTYTWANGDSYTGEFKANYINGHGKYTWVSGRTYEGEFLNGAIVRDPSVYPKES